MAMRHMISRIGKVIELRPHAVGGSLTLTRALLSSAVAKKPDMALIRELREASGAPIVDCKNALAVREKLVP